MILPAFSSLYAHLSLPGLTSPRSVLSGLEGYGTQAKINLSFSSFWSFWSFWSFCLVRQTKVWTNWQFVKPFDLRYSSQAGTFSEVSNTREKRWEQTGIIHSTCMNCMYVPAVYQQLRSTSFAYKPFAHQAGTTWHFSKDFFSTSAKESAAKHEHLHWKHRILPQLALLQILCFASPKRWQSRLCWFMDASQHKPESPSRTSASSWVAVSHLDASAGKFFERKLVDMIQPPVFSESECSNKMAKQLEQEENQKRTI